MEHDGPRREIQPAAAPQVTYAGVTGGTVGERLTRLEVEHEEFRGDTERRLRTLEDGLVRIYRLGWTILGAAVLVPILTDLLGHMGH